MINAIASLNPIAILVVSVAGFILGGLWYSPLLFVKPWLEEMKINPEEAKGRRGIAKQMVAAVAFTVVSTFTLAVLLAAHHTSGALKGAEVGLLVGLGLVAAREATNAVFSGTSLRLYLIVAGHDVALLLVQGAVLGVWR